MFFNLVKRIGLKWKGTTKVANGTAKVQKGEGSKEKEVAKIQKLESSDTKPTNDSTMPKKANLKNQSKIVNESKSNESMKAKSIQKVKVHQPKQENPCKLSDASRTQKSNSLECKPKNEGILHLADPQQPSLMKK